LSPFFTDGVDALAVEVMANEVVSANTAATAAFIFIDIVFFS
jgi:hypothetical protein